MKEKGIIASSYEEPYKSLSKYAPEKGLALDAGCGLFPYANFLKKHYGDIEMICIDILNKDPIEARKNLFLLASVEDLPFRNDSFDFIICMGVLQLARNDTGVVDEFGRVLNKKGRLLLTIPTRLSIFWLLRELEIRCGVYKRPEFNVKHYHYYTRADIRRLILKKFKIMDLHGYVYNFVPRLIVFLAFLFKADWIPRRLEKRFSERSNDKTDSYNTRSSSTKSSKLLEALRRKSRDFSYHYIVVLEKQ